MARSRSDALLTSPKKTTFPFIVFLTRVLHLAACVHWFVAAPWQDYLRPSVESILQSSLLADTVGEERRKALVRVRRKSTECVAAAPQAAASRVAMPEPASELRLKERVLRDREQALKEREERLERECVCVRVCTKCTCETLHRLNTTSPAFAKNLWTIWNQS